MMRDGCVMKITRSLEKMPLITKPTFGNATSDNNKINTDTEENTSTTSKPSSSKTPPKSCHIKRDLDTKENSSSAQTCRSLISPKTLLNGCSGSSLLINCPSRRNESLVLCSTTVGCLSNVPQPNQQPSGTGATVEEEGEGILVETEERLGSYDDVVLEGGDDDVVDERAFDVDYASEFDSGCNVWEEPDDDTHSPGCQVTSRDTVSVINNFKMQKINYESTTSQSTRNMRSHINESDHFNETRQHSVITEPSTDFAVPITVAQYKAGVKTSLRDQKMSNKISKTNTPSLFRHNFFIQGKTSTPSTSLCRPKAVVTQHTKHHETPKSSFTIYTDSAKPSRVSFCAPKKVLSSLSTNTPSSSSSRANNRSSICATGGQRITSPLCECGRRAKRQLVSNGGPNHGQAFFCCPVRRSGSGGRIQKGCEFFKWESALMKSSPAAAPAIGSSVSLCQMNSTLSCRRPQRSTLRKSY